MAAEMDWDKRSVRPRMYDAFSSTSLRFWLASRGLTIALSQ